MDDSIRPIDFLIAYGPVIIAWIGLSMTLALPAFSLLSAFLQTILILLWSYWGHRFIHTVSAIYPISLLNSHVSIHHDHVIPVPQWFNLILETFVNFMGFFFIVIIQQLTGIHIFSTSLILGAAFLYITIHILDFSLIGNPGHILHHERTFCNYDPEFMDTLFKTRCEPGTPYRNMSNEILHSIFAFLIAMGFKTMLHLD